MGKFAMRPRHWIVAAVATALLLSPLAVRVQAHTEHRSLPTLTATRAGLALNTPYLEYCQSAQNPNTTAERMNQLRWLSSHVVTLRDDPDGYATLEFVVENPDGYEVYVAYYAGPLHKQRCTFGLLQTNHPERDAAVQYFYKDRISQPFTPTREQFCYSKQAPYVTPPGNHGKRIVRMDCDVLDDPLQS